MTNNTTPDFEDVEDEEEAVNDLKDMINTLNELPTDVLQQLVKNLNDIDEYNATHKTDNN